MNAPAIGYSPWELYGPCDCGAEPGQPCQTGSTGAARLVVHHSRRPVDDVTGAGFTPVLTRDERQLLAAVHRWARQPLASPYSYLPRWERELGMPDGAWQRNTTADQPQTATVWFGPANRYQLTVKVHASRYGEELLDETVTPRSVREAVDLLVAWGILPIELSSAYRAGQRPALLSLPPAPQPWLPPGWQVDADLPRLVHPVPVTDPALRTGAD